MINILLTVYSKENCEYCVKAINLLKLKQINYKEIKLDGDRDVKKINELKQKYDHKTYPFIIFNEDGEDLFIGGYSDLVKSIDIILDL